MGSPPSYDLSHIGLSDDIVGKNSSQYNERKKLLDKYLQSIQKDKIFHDNTMGNQLNGEINNNRSHLMNILNNNHPIIKNKITIDKHGDRLNDLYNKYNDKKGGFPGASNILFMYNKSQSSLKIQKIVFDGLLYRITATNKDYNTKHIETNICIIKKKPSGFFSIRYNDINKDNLDLISWKKLDNIQDFSIKKNDQYLNGVIDDYDREYNMYLNGITYDKLKDNTCLSFKTDHKNALIGQKYSYNEEGTMVYYFRETGIAILECNRKKRITVRMPTINPFRHITNNDNDNLNADGFYLVNADISHHNLKNKNLEDKNIKVNKGLPIRYGTDTYIFLQKKYPDNLINKGQSNFMDKIFNGYNMTQYINNTRIYSFFYLLFNQNPIEKMDVISKKLSYQKINKPKDVIGSNKIGNFYWVKDKSTYFNKGSIIMPSDHNGFDDIDDFENIYNENTTWAQYRFVNPLFEYYPDDSLLSSPAYLVSLYKMDQTWYVDIITNDTYLTKILLSNINITDAGLDFLNSSDYIIDTSDASDNLSITCKPYVTINCHIDNIDFNFSFNGRMDTFHFSNLQDGLKWVNTIEFNDKKIPLSEFITINERLNIGSYIWDENKNKLYWIPNLQWKFEKFFFNNYELDIQSNILFMLQKENDKIGNTRKLLLDKMSNKKKSVRLDKNDVNNIIKLLKEN